MNSNALKKVEEERLVTEFFTEDDIRKIVIKRLREERRARIGLVNEIAILKGQLHYDSDESLINESVVTSIIEAIKAELSGSRAGGWNIALKTLLAVSTTVLTVYTVSFFAGLPWFISWKMKLIMGAATVSLAAASLAILFPLIDMITTGSSWDKVFLNTDENPVNKALVELRNKLNSDEIRMPEIPGGISYDPALEPAECNKEVEQYLSTQTSPITDFLGINEATLDSGGTANSPLGLDSDGFGFKVNKAARTVTVNNMVSKLKTGTSNIVEGVLDELTNFLMKPDTTLYDLQFIDREFGVQIAGQADGTDIVCEDHSSALTTRDGTPRSGTHFFATTAVIRGIVADPKKSNILHLMEHVNVYVNRLSLPGGRLNPISPEPWDRTKVSDYLNQSITISNYRENRYFILNNDVTDPNGPLQPYLLNKPITDVVPTHAKKHTSQPATLIGAGFFKELELGLIDRLIQYLKDLTEYCKQKIIDAYNWVGAKLASFLAWWQANVTPMLRSIGTAILTAGTGLWAWLTGLFESFWEWLTGLFDDDEDTDGGTSRESSRRGGGGSQRYRPEVEEMQRIMNRINDEKDLGGEEISVDGYWGPETNGMWEIVTNYAFDSGILKDDPDAGKYSDGFHKWPPMSRDLRDDEGTNYPDYTGDPQGALQLVKDIDGGSSRSGRGDEVDTDTERESMPRETQRTPRGETDVGGRVSTRGIRIQVDSGNNDVETLEDLGYREGTTQNVADAVMQSIRSPNFTGTSQDGLKLKVGFSRKGAISFVRRDRTQNAIPMINYNDLCFNIKRLLKSSGRVSELVDPESPTVTRTGFSKRTYTLVITIPSGVKQQR